MKTTLLLASALLITLTAAAQWGDEEMDKKAEWKERIFTGGGLGLSFSSYYDYVSVSPLIGYRITPKLAGGIQFMYRYSKYKQMQPAFTSNDYGVSPFLRFNFYGPLFLHAEYEYLNYQYEGFSGEKLRKGYNSFMAGGGFFQPMGRRAGFYALALYNFSYRTAGPNEITPYDSPLILRAGITAGF